MNERQRLHELKQPGNPGDPLSWQNTVGRPSDSYSIRNRNREMKRLGAVSPRVPLNMNREDILETQHRHAEGEANPSQSHFYNAIDGRRFRNPHFKRDVQ